MSSDINFGAISEELNNKADLDLANLPDNYDYVVDWQAPTADNNYTWYRKYKSGWVEQGGHTTSSDAGTICTFPVEMRDTNYSVLITVVNDGASNYSTTAKGKATTHIAVSTYIEERPCDWEVKGMAA